MSKIVSLALGLVIVLSGAASAATTYYVDPAKGASGGDGSEARPWKTLAEVVDGGRFHKVKAGDTVLLGTGYHGAVSISGKNADFITIAGGPGQAPTLSRLEVNGTKWRIKGLTVSPSLGDKPYEDSIITYAEGGESSEIIVEDCFVYTELDSSQWDAAKWKKVNNGITMGRNGKGHVMRNNYILNTRFAINLCAEDSLCEGNVVTNFSADGIRVTRDGQTVNYNVVKNNFVGAKDGDDNHDDGIQCFLFNKGTGTVRRVTVVGNIIINREDDAQKWHNPLQGIGFFDGPLIDFVVTDNVVLTAMWHGVSLYEAQNCRIERNVCWSRWKDNLRPWIRLGAKGKNPPSSPNVVKDNYACSFKYDVPGAATENNKPSTQQIMDQAMTRAHNVICEKFGKFHPVAGYARLGMAKGKNPEPAKDAKDGKDTKPATNPRNHP